MSASQKVPPVPCPACGAELDGAWATDGSGERPSPGDVTICIYCAEMLCYTAALGLRPAAPDDLYRLGNEAALGLFNVLRAVSARIHSESPPV